MATIVVTEIMESQHLDELDDGSAIGERHFEISNQVSGALLGQMNLDDARNAGAPIPLIGDPFAPGLLSVECVRRSFRKRAGIQQYVCVASYRGEPTIFPPQFTEFREPVDVWRMGVEGGVPVPGGPAPGLYTDIGGTPIDENGQPVQLDMWFLKIAFSVLHDIIDPDLLPWASWGNLIGAVSATAFHGRPPQTIKYLGPVHRILRPTKHLITHEFMYDKSFFYRQTPQLNVNRSVRTILGAGDTQHAVNVYWRRIAEIQDFGVLGV